MDQKEKDRIRDKMNEPGYYDVHISPLSMKELDEVINQRHLMDESNRRRKDPRYIEQCRQSAIEYHKTH